VGAFVITADELFRLHQMMRQQIRAKDKEIAQLKRKLQAIEAKLGM
jgi:hypothetical protein